jgi:uncharacterized protein (DUF1778 family)
MTPHGGSREGSGRKPMPPDEKARPMMLKLPPGFLAAIDACATAEGLNRTQFVIRVLRAYLDAHQDDAG